MKVKVQGLDEEIRTIVRGQADMGHDGRQALEEVHTHILYTYSHTHSQYTSSLHQQVRSHVLSENYIKYCVAVCYVLTGSPDNRGVVWEDQEHQGEGRAFRAHGIDSSHNTGGHGGANCYTECSTTQSVVIFN